MKKITLVISLIFILISPSCVPSKPAFEKKVLPADRLLKRIEANRRKIKLFSGTGSMHIQTNELDSKASFEILIRKPDSIKISLFGPFGIDVAQALITKEDFLFYDVLNDRAFTGRITKDALEKIFKINLSFEDLIDAFAGAVNLTPRLSENPSTYDITDDNYILTYNEGQRSYRYIVDIIENSLKEYKILGGKEDVLVHSRFTNFNKFEDVPIPNNTIIKNYADNQTVTIEYRKIKVNEETGSLKIELPEDIDIIKWQ